MVSEAIKKPVRSLLFRAPALHAASNGQWRYRLLHWLRLVHEPDFRLLPAHVDNQTPLVIDVGGNVGQSVLSVLTVLPRARIVTFDPDPANAPALEGLARRFPAVRFEPVGLGREAGRRELFTPVYRGRRIGALASFDETAARSWLGPERVRGFDSSRLEVHKVTVDVRPLDDFNFEPDVVKIDVQGLEHEVIMGGQATIARARPVIMVETLDRTGEAGRLLRDLEYREVAGRGNALLVPRPPLGFAG